MQAEMHRHFLRGRRPVRADRRLRTDEKRVRTQSAILDKTQTQIAFAFIHNPVFDTDAFFIRIENRVGARSAQWAQVHWASRGGRFERQRSILYSINPLPVPVAEGGTLGAQHG
jgi:hypothetical protein